MSSMDLLRFWTFSKKKNYQIPEECRHTVYVNDNVIVTLSCAPPPFFPTKHHALRISHMVLLMPPRWLPIWWVWSLHKRQVSGTASPNVKTLPTRFDTLYKFEFPCPCIRVLFKWFVMNVCFIATDTVKVYCTVVETFDGVLLEMTCKGHGFTVVSCSVNLTLGIREGYCLSTQERS